MGGMAGGMQGMAAMAGKPGGPRNPIMVLILTQFAANILGQILTRILLAVLPVSAWGIVSIVGYLINILAIVLWLYFMKPMAEETKTAAQDPSLNIWVAILIPFYGPGVVLYNAMVRAKQMAQKPPPKAQWLYFIFPAFGLAHDLNDIHGHGAPGMPGMPGMGGPPMGGPPMGGPPMGGPPMGGPPPGGFGGPPPGGAPPGGFGGGPPPGGAPPGGFGGPPPGGAPPGGFGGGPPPGGF